MFVDYLDTRFIARPLPKSQLSNVVLRERQLHMIFGLILVAAIVMLILMACGQLAYNTVLYEENFRLYPSTRSELHADCSPWKPVVFKPIKPEIVDDIYRDLGVLDSKNQSNFQGLVARSNIVETTSNP
jgi:hypothetical protein